MQQLEAAFAVAAQNGMALGFKRTGVTKQRAHIPWKPPVTVTEARRRMKVWKHRTLHCFSMALRHSVHPRMRCLLELYLEVYSIAVLS